MERSAHAYTSDYPWDPSRTIDEVHALFERDGAPLQSEMMLDRDPGERNKAHPALGSNNKRVLAYERTVGKGAVCYIGMGHNSVRMPEGKRHRQSAVNCGCL